MLAFLMFLVLAIVIYRLFIPVMIILIGGAYALVESALTMDRATAAGLSGVVLLAVGVFMLVVFAYRAARPARGGAHVIQNDNTSQPESLPEHEWFRCGRCTFPLRPGSQFCGRCGTGVRYSQIAHH